MASLRTTVKLLPHDLIQERSKGIRQRAGVIPQVPLNLHYISMSESHLSPSYKDQDV